MKHVAVMGSKKSGKTFVAAYLVERFSKDGYRVAAVKHIHHEFTIDTEGKDTWKMSRSGAEIVASVSPNETAVLFYNSRRWGSNLLRLTDVLEREGIELTVYEGFHNLLGRSPTVYKILTVKENSDAEMLRNLEPPFLAVFRREASLSPEVGLPVFGPELSDEFYHHVKGKLGLG
ncbi:MAG: molybdopterin-guanine dinucleotide biosynthesis protein B [Candidatus Caldarchaeum sp.]|nr:molybdopterin-guanine dinucleotide biosynthesis protein B [Candidatus Caldarchaeum sp.]